MQLSNNIIMFDYWITSIAAIVLACCQAVVCSSMYNAERQLFDVLTRFYDPDTRPVMRADSIVTVNLSISLHQIMDLDEKNQTLITHSWIYEEWHDEVLQWDPSDYEGISSIILPPEYIWVPDLYIFNNAEKGEQGFIGVNDSRAIAHHTGRVEWVIPLMIKSSCEVFVAYFPFDSQHCHVRFGSWVYDDNQLDLQQKQDQVDLSHFVSNSELDLIAATLTHDTVPYDIFTGMYSQIVMELHIRRKPLYYLYTVIAPTLVLCILTLSSFLLPCDNGEKVGIGLTVFLSLYVLQLAVAENIPESNSLPLLVLFLTLVMTLNAVSLLFATLVINIKKKGDRVMIPEVPHYLMTVCKKFLSKITCTKMLTYYDLYDSCDGLKLPCVDEEEDDTQQTTEANSPLMGGAQHGANGRSKTTAVAAVKNKHSRTSNTNRWMTEEERRRIDDKGPRELRLEWYFVAQVIDKFLFIIFVTASALTVAFTLIIIPAMHAND